MANPYGTYNPQVFVPGNHSGFADLDPGTPATVDPPDLDEATANTTGGTLAGGTYEYAVTDQFNGADSTTTDQSQAYVTDGLQGDLAPVVVTGSTGSVDLVWQSICHAANYIVYRAPVSGGKAGSWTEIGTYATPDSATLPDNSSGDTSPAQTATVCSGPTYAPTSCAGEQELTFTDTGGTTGAPAGVTYLDTPMPAGWTPPIVENANELPWEQNPYFSSALTAVGITTVGADASKAYPDPANDAFGIGATYTGATYAAGQPFVDGTSQVAPRHPINVFYNVATNAQELDEYNTLYTSVAPDSQCHDTSTTTCASTLYTFPEVINQVVSGMFTNMLSNDPEVSYVHQTNTMGTPPYSTTLPPANYVPAATAQPGTDGDGTLYEVLNPLISEYDSYFTADTPYQQLTLGGIGQVLADQTAWSAAETAGTVKATEENGVVTVTNTGTGAVNVPVTVPPGTTVGGSAFGSAYDGQLSGLDQCGRHRHHHPHRERRPDHHQRQLGCLQRGCALFHHRDHHREPGTSPHRDRCPAHRHHLHRQRQRDGHHLGHPGRRHRGLLPDHHHGQECQRHRHPGLHPDQRTGPDHHLCVHSQLHRGHRRHLHGDHHRVPGRHHHRVGHPALRASPSPPGPPGRPPSRAPRPPARPGPTR